MFFLEICCLLVASFEKEKSKPKGRNLVLFGRKVFSRLKIPFECFLFLFGQKVIRPPLSRDI